MRRRQDTISLLSLTIILTLTLVVFPPLVTSNCYLPNAKQISDEYQPCSNGNTKNPDVSMCCATNRSIPSGGFVDNSNANTQDVCLENGLCLNQAVLTENGTNHTYTSYWRSLCTTTAWNTGCLNICTQSKVWYSA